MNKKIYFFFTNQSLIALFESKLGQNARQKELDLDQCQSISDANPRSGTERTKRDRLAFSLLFLVESLRPELFRIQIQLGIVMHRIDGYGYYLSFLDLDSFVVKVTARHAVCPLHRRIDSQRLVDHLIHVLHFSNRFVAHFSILWNSK